MYCSISIGVLPVWTPVPMVMSKYKTMRGTLKPVVQCDEERCNIEFCANLGHCSLWCMYFFTARWTQG